MYVPNWFRWLVIIIATLIMCACRSPLQEGGQLPTGGQFVPPIVPGPQVTTQDVTLLPAKIAQKAAVVSHSSDEAQAHQARQTHHHGSTDDQLQKIEALLSETEETNAYSPKQFATTHATRTGNAQSVYLRVRDQNEPIGTVGAQLDADVGTGLGSEFGNNPQPAPVAMPGEPFATGSPAQTGASVMPESALGADSSILQPESAIIPQQPQEMAVPYDAHTMQSDAYELTPYQYDGQLESPTISPDSPILAEDAVQPTYQEPEVVFPAAPYEEYLPVEVIPNCAPEDWANNPFEGLNRPQRELARRYPDEYICDGGDRNGQVVVMNDWSLRNLDPEDTVGHYDTKDNRVVVAPSNRVCVYAPRFASARKVSGAFVNLKEEQALTANRSLRGITDSSSTIADQYSQTLAPLRHLLVQPAVSLKRRQPGVEGLHRQAVNIAVLDLSPHEDFRILKYGVHKQSEKARLAEYSAKAVSWSHDKAVQVVIDEEVLQTEVSRAGVGQIFFVGDNGPAKLRVIKTASKEDALPGEEIEFTLRFDNVGFQTIGNVTVIDNLTTRLELIPDSDLCSLENDFFFDENDAESLTLRWEIIEPIEAGKGGIIRFRCRVR